LHVYVALRNNIAVFLGYFSFEVKHIVHSSFLVGEHD